ncbi:MAG: hypothetical protein H6832_14125 [Planctomycetes bacterium]|nr:hypothetical protein [Planctomycetota bacterium]MCB9919535.1 hypothetical protein [Planctomycetota bacterium]
MNTTARNTSRIGVAVLFACVAAGQSLSAQRVDAVSNIGVFAREASAASFKFVAKNTQLSLPFSLATSLPNTDAATKITALRSGQKQAYVINQVGGSKAPSGSAGTSDSSSSRNFQPGPQVFKFRFPAAVGTRWLVVATIQGRINGRAAGGGAFDVDGDSQVDWAARALANAQSKSFQLVAGAAGIEIEVASDAIANTTGTITASSYQTIVQFSIEPDPRRCVATEIGSGCGPRLGVRESSSSTGDTLAFATNNATPGGLSLFLLGDRALNVQFPGTRCYLHTNPLIIFGRIIDRNGNASIQFDLPKNFEGRFTAQDVILVRSATKIGIESTNGLGIACRKG